MCLVSLNNTNLLFTVLSLKSKTDVTGLKIKELARLHFFQCSEEDTFPCLFQLLETASFLGSCPFLFLQSLQWYVKSFLQGISNSSFIVALSNHSQESVSTFKDSYDQIEPIHIIQDNLIFKATMTFFLPNKVTQSQVWGNNMWTSLEPLFCLPQQGMGLQSFQVHNFKYRKVLFRKAVSLFNK